VGFLDWLKPGLDGVQAGSKTRIHPPPYKAPNGETEKLRGWGFEDSEFSLNPRGHIELSGRRYTISGQEMPFLLPWMSEVTRAAVGPGNVHQPLKAVEVPAARDTAAFRAAVLTFLSAEQLSDDAGLRARHGHGHTLKDIYRVTYENPHRVPDLVVYPSEEEHVERLVQAAREHAVCLIPYGGGTNVTEALECPEEEVRPIVSVDMQRMNRILWIDPENMTAHIQAGAVGRNIQRQLRQYGFTMGHEPDSVEFSTLGGWVATNASGMKKNRYGNIEDLVLDLRVVTPQGIIERYGPMPRESTGVDPRRCFFGSEGNLGVITSAVVKIFRLPEVERFGSVLFPTFSHGVKFMYELARSRIVPASVRLVDNMQFQFGQSLKAKPTSAQARKSKLEKFFVLKVKGFDPKQMVAVTIVFEGSEREVAMQEETVYSLAKKHRGMKAGEENGKKGYQLTFGIAYIRDFVLRHYIAAESFETSVPWANVEEVCRRARERAEKEHHARKLPGEPFFSCRVTQLYDSGVCIYFYLGFFHLGVNDPVQVYSELESAVREEILEAGGSLSHHHGVGKIRERYLSRVMSEPGRKFVQQIKSAVDPENIFGARNHGVGRTTEAADLKKH
jgi:alkyldihydroxyacetonephosphate synthase